MQFIVAIVALATAAVAAPSGESWECTFGQYECSWKGDSIKQCDISGKWVVSSPEMALRFPRDLPDANHDFFLPTGQTVGPCPDGTSCHDSAENGLPYCFADASKEKRGASTSCAAPGTYSCTWDHKGINVCDSQNVLEFNGACPEGTHCQNLASANNIPFCVTNGW